MCSARKANVQRSTYRNDYRCSFYCTWTRECRGFGFVTMSMVKEADRCIECLDHSVLEGRIIIVEKGKEEKRSNDI
uniref:RRM domain-containing protein n=1 Tax=Nelumbo nucifera TaxID=4432 RepID=A0A822Z5W2_NELNU|nr:TPA_asm: hypothetical protein HUJ06_013147 [Nelumbo nucifera]